MSQNKFINDVKENIGDRVYQTTGSEKMRKIDFYRADAAGCVNGCRKIRFYRADAAGNVTLFVMSPVDDEYYADVARCLLKINELDGDEIAGEQVAFVVDEDTMCMCGHEFCGNASRSFALMKARGLIGGKQSDDKCSINFESASSNSKDEIGFVDNKMKNQKNDSDTNNIDKQDVVHTITINASGADHPLDVLVDAESGFTKIKMPGIARIDRYAESGITHVVWMDGIAHAIVQGVEPTLENFELIKERVFGGLYPPAVGVIFVDGIGDICGGDEDGSDTLLIDGDLEAAWQNEVISVAMTPVVYVTEAGTTYFEGSCGSGTTALCAVLSLGKDDGVYVYDVGQPKGTIRCSCTVLGGSPAEVFIEGPVNISREYEVLI